MKDQEPLKTNMGLAKKREDTLVTKGGQARGQKEGKFGITRSPLGK